VGEGVGEVITVPTMAGVKIGIEEAIGIIAIEIDTIKIIVDNGVVIIITTTIVITAVIKVNSIVQIIIITTMDGDPVN